MTGISAIPPGLPLVLGALLLPLFGLRIRAALVLGLPLLTLALVWQIPDGVSLRFPFLEYELVPVSGDRLSRLFGTVFAIMTFAGGLFALNRARVLELVAALISAGSAVGVTFAGDLITLVAFWELL
ncbi:MAG: Na+/H+ antiporter subunit D, partial [Gammaproteobacteria bacterium]|nr:Na+/H+ antiporter subunit D [Gammaproteobacteria bacterium]